MTGHQQPLDSTSKLTQRLDINFALQAAGLGVWELDPATKQVVWDDRCRELFGLAKNNQLPYQQALQSIHPDDRDRVNQAVETALDPRLDGVYDQTFRTLGAKQDQLRWVRLHGRSYFSPAGELFRFAGIAQEVTQQVETQRQQRIHQAITASSPDLMYVFDLNYRFTYANQALLAMWGSTWEQSIGKSLLENGYEPWHAQMHEREIDQVVATKQPIRGEVSFPHATLGKRIYDYVFAPVLNEAGEVEAVAGTTRDITDIKQTQALKLESQQELLALFEQSPVGLATISANEQLVFEWANAFYGQLVDRSPQAIVGKPLLEALPEIKGQGFDNILKEVTATGIPFVAPEVTVNILRDGQLTTIYVNLTFQPRKGADDTVKSILVVATDVTQQVKSRQEIEASQQLLRDLVLAAPIGISILNAADLVIETVNDTFLEIAGKPYEQLMDQHYWVPFAEAALYYADALNRVAQQGEPFSINEVELMLIRHGKEERIYVTFVYMPIKDVTGRVEKVAVWVLENTHQVVQRRKVEELVQQRTEELATANEELAATNEELAAANEELEASNEEYEVLNEELSEANGLLTRSNENLQQFAYVASHDLQEPLRKIQTFSELLRNQYGETLGTGVDYLNRMQAAASRMSSLIRDLLTYSRVSTQRETNQVIALQTVVQRVVADLDLLIQETGATVLVRELPTVLGDASQLGQLFQNLMGNSLKFRREGITPLIEVSSNYVASAQLPPFVKPVRNAPGYLRLDVRDNGIGFDEQYVDRIFQVFQRLHSKRQYSGTGIGLAICERVAANHGGAITATSQPGQGATFSVYLPVQ